MKVHVSGKAYEAAMDPDVTDVPKEYGWPVPEMVRRGIGVRMVYDVTPEQAEEIAFHLKRQADMFRTADRDSRTQARAIDIDVSRIRIELEGSKVR